MNQSLQVGGDRVGKLDAGPQRRQGLAPLAARELEAFRGELGRRLLPGVPEIARQDNLISSVGCEQGSVT
jgi:hypothetical protein